MTDKNLTEIIAIVDRSGSMTNIMGDAIEGFNSFLKDQQKLKAGKCLLTYVQFDDVIEVVHNGIDINSMKFLNEKTFSPRGMTALFDAIGITIDTVGKRLAKTPEDKRPGNVIVVILTDGGENSSGKYTADMVKEIVNRQTEKYNWAFIYLAQNISAFETGAVMGFSSSKNVLLGDVKSGGDSMKNAYYLASAAASNRRYKSIRRGGGASGQSVCMDWSDREQNLFSDAAESGDVSELEQINEELAKESSQE